MVVLASEIGIRSSTYRLAITPHPIVFIVISIYTYKKMPVKIQIFTEYKVPVILHCNAGALWSECSQGQKT